MTIESIELFHKRARPNPADKDFNVQLGCHLEEIAEMLEQLTFHEGILTQDGKTSVLYTAFHLTAENLKAGRITATVNNRVEFLDSLADQVDTAVGVGHCAGMQTSAAVADVDSSNWSKFDDNGQPIFDVSGKITKGPNYRKPNLGAFV